MDDPEWLTVSDMAARLGLHERTVRRLVLGEGGVPHVRLGRLIRVRRTAFEDWIRSLETVPARGTERGRRADF